METPNVTIKQLRAFVALFDERSFTRAASRLFVTQSTLTSAVRVLEQQVGVPLFARTTRSVEPTVEALAFLPLARRLLEELGRSVADLRAYASGQQGSVVAIGANSFIHYVLAPALAVLAQRHPGIEVKLLEETTETVEQKILSGEADFGVTTSWGRATRLDMMPLLFDRFGVVCQRSHPLARRRQALAWQDLDGHRQVGLVQANGIRLMLDAHPRVPAGLKQPAYQVSSVSLLAPALRGLSAIAIVPAMAARPILGDDLVFRPLSPSIERALSLVKRPGQMLSPAAGLFEGIVLAQVRGLGRDRSVRRAPMPPSAFCAVQKR